MLISNFWNQTHKIEHALFEQQGSLVNRTPNFILAKEERTEGKTVEVGRGFFETEKRRYSILDAPDHKAYVPSMIGRASQADVGILVISARKGEYETDFERGG